MLVIMIQKLDLINYCKLGIYKIEKCLIHPPSIDIKAINSVDILVMNNG